MKTKISDFCRIFAGLALFLYASSGVADQAPNPRSAVAMNSGTARSGGAVVSRGNGKSGAVVSRSAIVNAARNSERGAVVSRAARQNTVSRAATNGAVSNRSGGAVSRSATPTKSGVARSANVAVKNNARSASRAVSNMGMARAANMARATAVFNDLSKIGGGYAQCRDAYSTCMDQFCANANDTYRRCYCSQRFTDFRETELALDEAKVLLQRFEDNNLNAVDKTAAEVNAMYTATVGEAAIKNDVSGAQSILNEIGDLLSGKKKVESNKTPSLDALSMDFSLNMDDIWGSSNSMFDTPTGRGGQNFAEMEGAELYNATNKQCLEIVSDACTSDAVLNMATSAYNIMITQDCNLYEKKIDTQREAVMNTVRQAEKYLREARLEEYRSHNSADVNECIAKVRTAIQQDTACGEGYKRCLDYTGNYINQTTGEPIYSPLLFKLVEIINLYGGNGTNSDVLGMNPQFNKFLDGRRMFAETALDTCRDNADLVWTEFKRTALIEIAQAQDAKIEEVKSSCVTTMGECYDSQSGQLKDFDKTTAQSSGALAANAARAMCADKVAACAALYGDNGSAQCNFDSQGRLTNPEKCGLTELLNYVGLVDSVKIAEGCADALTKYTQELCAPASTETERAYPWGCRSLSKTDLTNDLTDKSKVYCVDIGTDSSLKAEIADDEKVVAKLTNSIFAELAVMFDNECEKMGGLWMDASDDGDTQNALLSYTGKPLQDFYVAIDGERWNTSAKNDSDAHATGSYGKCFENSVQLQCQWQDENTGSKGYAKYENGRCVFTPEWYQIQCSQIGGYYVDEQCYIEP